jgi:hypothetical protein
MMQQQQNMPVEAGKVSWFGRQLTEEEFLETMVQEQRLDIRVRRAASLRPLSHANERVGTKTVILSATTAVST